MIYCMFLKSGQRIFLILLINPIQKYLIVPKILPVNGTLHFIPSFKASLHGLQFPQDNLKLDCDKTK